MFKQFNILILILLLSSPLIFSQNNNSTCNIYISNINSSDSNNCGSNANPCQTLGGGLQSCINQSLSNTIVFTFDNDTFELSNNDLFTNLVNQSITLLGTQTTILNLGQINSSIFTVSTGLSNQTNTISLSSLIFQNYQSTISLFNIQTASTTNVNIANCQFNNLSSKMGSIFNINQLGNTTTSTITAYNVNFENITSSTSSAIIFSKGSIAASFQYCIFTNIAAQTYTFGLISKGNLQVTSSIFKSSVVSSESLISLYGNNPQYLFHSFQNTTFDGITTTNAQTVQPVSIISHLQNTVNIQNSVFSNNVLTAIDPFNSNLTITNTQFINNSLPLGPLIYGETSTVLLNNATFSNNLITSKVYSLLTSDTSTLDIGTSTFTSNDGNLISSNFSQVSINGLTLDNNTFNFIIADCYHSKLVISDQTTLFPKSAVQCQDQCDITSVDNALSCESITASSDDKKPKDNRKDIIIGVSITVSIVALVIIIFIVYRCYRHHHRHHHYHAINSHHH